MAALPFTSMLRHPAGHKAQRGLTLIEVTIAILIAAMLFGAAVSGIGAITGTKAKSAAGELAGVIRSMYDTAGLSGKTCRLVFELPPSKDDETPVKYWAECAAGNITTSRDRDEELKDANTEKDAHEFSSSSNNTLQDLLAQEKQRVEASARFSSFTTPEIEPRTFPSSVRVSLWTRHQAKAATTGLAYLYFFPQGFTERAQVYLRQGDNVWTISVSPLTGKAKIVSEELEIPRT